MMEIPLRQGNNWLKQNGYTLEEEELIYDLTLEDVFDNPGWYLDHLDFLSEYRVCWKDYRYKYPTMPYKYVKTL